ncbi:MULTISPECIES: sporulation YhaL family protein [Bacillaceae]|uniref:Sporulation YhaL family protein n=1 Tax=Metabacillus endolithicus TaxID=1535204 RepID=A0ABW5C3H3_9BACI|nr:MULTISPECIES: sporulation YhaL family protein [Bacillaceae]PGT90433.1 SigE-dependent sporulation protein [Bacillus sp. AFS040349]UGB31616.1 sporulation YhaL family protein [Metabacillus sp. B2-18]UPG62287.1 sporulation YhaL family protein [Metabacillus endolithicus]
MFVMPWWIYLCIIGILVSGYMAFKTARQDKQIDDTFIEQEGQVYLDRIEKERQKKRDLLTQQPELQDDQTAS